MKVKRIVVLFLVMVIIGLGLTGNKLTAEANDMYPTIMLGDKSSNTAYLQELLLNAGYYNDYIDGSFGPYTQSCVMYFQEANHLTIDGIVGAETWYALVNSQLVWPLTEREQMLLAELIYHEDGGECYESQYYVACAILNLTKILGRSLESIAYDYNVFEVAPYFMDNIDATTTQWDIVNRLMNEGPQSDVCYFRTDYYHPFGTPAFEINNVYFSYN